MQADDPLTPRQIEACKRVGLSVTTCVICKRQTLYALSALRPVAPITCGRMPCLRTYGEEKD